MAGKKRLNKTVIIILASVLVLLVTGALGVWIYKRPKDPDVCAERAAEFLKQGNYELAVKNYYLAKNAVGPDDSRKPEYLLAWAETMLEWRRKGENIGPAQKNQLFHTARSALKDAVRFKPDYVKARRLLTQLEYAMGRGGGDWSGYLDSVGKLLELVPEDHKVLFQQAWVKGEIAKTRPEYLAPAMKDFTALVKLAPTQEQYWIELARMYQLYRGERADWFEQAENTYKDALKANPKSVRIRIAYARLLQQKDERKNEALKLLTDAVEFQEPKEIGAHLALAMFHQQEGEVDKAVTWIEKAREVNPEEHSSYVGLAQIHIARRDFAKAESVLLKGLEVTRKNLGEGAKDNKALNRYNGIMLLNNQLCDTLLSKPSKGDERKKNLQRVRDALKEMRSIRDNKNLHKIFTARITPYVTKVEGRIALAEGRRVEAEKLLRRAYDSFTTIDGRPFFERTTAVLLINLYANTGQPGNAREILDRYQRYSGGSPNTLMAIVKLHIESRSYTEAQRLLNVILEKDTSEKTLSLKAALEIVTGRSNRIPAEMRELDSLAMKLFLRRGQQLWLEGESEAAIRLVADVLDREPKHLGAMMQLIRWHMLRNEVTEAKAIFDHAGKVFKDKPAVQKQLLMLIETNRGKLLAQQLEMASKMTDPVRRALLTASIYRSFGMEKKQIEYLKQAEVKDPRNKTVIRQMFEYSLNKEDWKSAQKYADAAVEVNIDYVGGRMFRARLAAVRRKYDEAIRLTHEALEIRPRFSHGYSFLGDCYLAVGKIEQAREQYSKAYTQNPSNLQALLGMIRVNEITGKYDEAARWIKLAYKFAPRNPLILEKYLRLRDSVKDPEKVIKQREMVLKSQPNNLANISHLAILYERTGRMKKAEWAFRAMMRISRGKPLMVGALADFLRRRGRDVEARALLAKNAATAEDKVLAHLLWAGYLDSAGDAEQAKIVYQKALTANPSNARIYLGLAQFTARHRQWSKAADYQKKYINLAGDKAIPQARRDFVIYLIEANRDKEAEKELSGILEKNRTDVEMLTLMAKIRIKQKDNAGAMEVLNRALRIHPTYFPALIYRSDVHWLNGNKTRAIADLEAAVRAGAGATIAVRLAGIYKAMGNYANARNVLRGVLSKDPTNLHALKAMIGLYKSQKRWVLMEPVLKTGRKAYPKNLFFLQNEVGMWLAQKLPAKALAPAETALKLYPKHPRVALLWMQVLVEAGLYNKALSAGQSMRTRKDVGPEVMAVSGRALAKLGRGAGADADFAAAIKNAKPGRQLHFVLSQIRLTYPPDKIVEKLTRWAGIRPGQSQIHEMTGRILMMQNKNTSAVEHLKKALANARTDRDRAIIKRNMGMAYFRLKQYDQSLKMYQDTLKINPSDAGTLNNLAWLLASNFKRPDKAVPYAKRAAEMMPDDVNVQDTYGYILLLKGNYDEALKVLNRSIIIKAIPANRLHLAQTYEKMDRKEEALRQYRQGWKLIKNNPKDPSYRELRDGVKRLGGAPGGSVQP